MKRRQLLALLLLAVLALTISPAALADGETEIATAQDMLMLGAMPQGNYVLTRDIDMSGMDWTPVAFEGTLRGNGHTIYNLTVERTGGSPADTVDGNDKVYSTVFAGLFSTLIGARVEGVTLRGVDMNIRSETHCFAGGLAGFIQNAEIVNCAVLDARISLTAAIRPDPADARTSCNAGVGGIAGFGSGSITDSTAEVTLVFDDQCDPSLKCEEFMGGILACGNAAIRNCAVVIDGYDACRGYAHNGGLVGMFYVYNKQETARPISWCSVNGMITFFEDNRDRRAYCQPFVGELLTWTDMSNCSQLFTRNELFDYTAVLRPEKCEEPALTEEVLIADCENWGYTSHTCTVCGNHWNDSFVAPAHTPGEWEVLSEPTETENGFRQLRCTVCGQIIAEESVAPHVPGEWVTVTEPGLGRDGLRQLLCADCGAVLQEEVIPGQQTVQALVLDQSLLELRYLDDWKIGAESYPADAVAPILYWTSSNERVATVDTNGTVHAVGRGTAVITCTSADGAASGQCQVNVSYTFRQWLTKVFLFGWIWY